ncbi:MAG: porin [Rhodobacteraceae bacterium]|nr:porin [Paracoccaceae bacterium]
MKKVLFATTALVASAGFAAAQGIEISGSAEMGYAGGGAGVTEGFFQSVDVRFSMAGETDNGLTFGAVIDLDDSQQDNTNLTNAFADFTVFVSGAFGTLTLGDTDGAMDWAMQEANTAGSPGSLNDAETGHAGYEGSYLDGDADGNGQILRYDNSFGDFGVAVSIEMGADGTDTLDTGYALGATYNLAFAGGSVRFGAAFQEAAAVSGNGESAAGISAALAMDSGFEATLAFTDVQIEGGNDYTHTGLGLGYAFGPFSLHANYGIDNVNGAADNTGYGVAAGYDLGGGADLLFGYGSGSTAGAADIDTYSLGLSMSF